MVPHGAEQPLSHRGDLEGAPSWQRPFGLRSLDTQMSVVRHESRETPCFRVLRLQGLETKGEGLTPRSEHVALASGFGQFVGAGLEEGAKTLTLGLFQRQDLVQRSTPNRHWRCSGCWRAMAMDPEKAQ